MPYFLCINQNGVSSVKTDAEIIQSVIQGTGDADRPVLRNFLMTAEVSDFYDFHDPSIHAVMEHVHYVRLGRRHTDDKRKQERREFSTSAATPLRRSAAVVDRRKRRTP